MSTPPSRPRIDPAPGSDPATLNVFRTMLNAPALNEGFLALGGHLLGAGVLPARERELVILRVGFRAGSEYEFAQHTRIGIRAGLSEAEVAHIAGGPGEWSGPDADLLALVDELCADGVVGERTWRALAARWDSAQLLELLVLAGFYRLVSGVLCSVGVALEPGSTGWPDGVDLPRAPRA